MKLEALVITAFIAALIAIVVIIGGAIAENDHQAYAAWIKLTDNPKHLSFREWQSLKSATTDTQPQFIYIHQ